jgi:hypothetical protein
MTTLREAAQQALEALEIGYDSAQVEAAQYHAAMAGYRPERHAAMDADVAKIAAAITALRAALPCTYKCEAWPECACAALAQQGQEPVAWTDRELELIDGMIEVQLHHAAQCDGIANRTMAEKQKSWDMERVALLQKIKSNPPRREWRSLSEEEIQSIHDTYHKRMGRQEFARAIEQALKEKNHE